MTQSVYLINTLHAPYPLLHLMFGMGATVTERVLTLGSYPILLSEMWKDELIFLFVWNFIQFHSSTTIQNEMNDNTGYMDNPNSSQPSHYVTSLKGVTPFQLLHFRVTNPPTRMTHSDFIVRILQ